MSGSGPFQDKPAVKVEALTLARGERVLVRDLNLRAEGGDYIEVRGGNGVGKTTLLRAIAGLTKAQSGSVAVSGAAEAQEALHYVGHLNGLKPTVSARAHVRYWAGLFGAADDAGALERVGLAAQAELPARVLSQGQARRLALSRLLIARRPVWLLDEPAAALDAQGRALLDELIASHRGDGGLVIAAVHEPLGAAPSQTLDLGA
jgi:heme exporter protein A